MADRKYLIKSGQRFGKLIIIKEFYDYKNNHKIRSVKCLCDCGNETIQRVVDINTTVSSCGCNRGNHKNRNKYTGMPIRSIYKRMKVRCYSKNNKDYKYYGGRGITICQKWLDNPLLFYEWSLDNGYKKGLTIERKDNNKEYSPENCEFVDRGVQANNKRNNIIVEYDNKIFTLIEFCRKYNLNYNTVTWRFKKNYPVENLLLNCGVYIPTNKTEKRLFMNQQTN